jgi:AcrR family transcriptional regulator
MPRVSEEHKTAVRERLIQAAATLLARQGYHATSTRDIMRHAGVSAGTFYHYFPSKDALIAAVGDAIAERELESGLSASIEGQPAAVTIAQVALQIFAPRRPYSMLPSARTQAEHVPAIREALSRYDKRLVASLARATEEAKQDGDLDEEIDAQALSELAALVFEGLQARARAKTYVSSYERVGRTFLRLLARGATRDGSRFRDEIDKGLAARE